MKEHMKDPSFPQTPFTGHRDMLAGKLRGTIESERMTEQISLYMGPYMIAWLRGRNERTRQGISDLVRELITGRMGAEFGETWKRACELNGFNLFSDLIDFEPFANGWICKGAPGDPEATLVHPDGRAWFCIYDEDGHLTSQEPLFQE